MVTRTIPGYERPDTRIEAPDLDAAPARGTNIWHRRTGAPAIVLKPLVGACLIGYTTSSGAGRISRTETVPLGLIALDRRKRW